MASYTLADVDPVVVPGTGAVIYEFNVKTANGGTLAVGDKISTPKITVPATCRRIVLVKATDTSNADVVALQGYLGSGPTPFLTPCMGQATGVTPTANYTNAAGNYVSQQAPVCCSAVDGYVTLAGTVPATARLILAFCPE